MRRFAMDKLLDWKKKSNRKPLILMGARQVGKTWLMKEFGKTYYEKTAYISFYNNQRMQAVFDTDFDIKRIIMNLNIESGVAITPENTLIVLDEIQNAPKALESLKYFCEEAPEYHVIAAGSLLGVALHEGISYPVGKVDLLDLYPFNFREFLCAMDEEGLESALETKDYNLIDNFSDKYLFWLKNYYYTGGMPAVVDAFRLNKDYAEVRQIQSDIIRQYEGDFGKHIKAKVLPRIRMVQKAVSETDEAGAKRRMQASYSQRNLMQMLWAVLAIVLPCFQFAAGILPLLIPGTAIKLMGIKNSIKR